MDLLNKCENSRMTPIFAPVIWNLYERALNNEDRTVFLLDQLNCL